MWQNPMCAIAAAGGDIHAMDKRKFQEDFDEFYDEIFEEFHKYGKLEDVQVCENLGDHMVGLSFLSNSDGLQGI
jgi:splicing factor U2AF subunit